MCHASEFGFVNKRRRALSRGFLSPCSLIRPCPPALSHVCVSFFLARSNIFPTQLNSKTKCFPGPNKQQCIRACTSKLGCKVKCIKNKREKDVRKSNRTKKWDPTNCVRVCLNKGVPKKKQPIQRNDPIVAAAKQRVLQACKPCTDPKKYNRAQIFRDIVLQTKQACRNIAAQEVACNNAVMYGLRDCSSTQSTNDLTVAFVAKAEW